VREVPNYKRVEYRGKLYLKVGSLLLTMEEERRAVNRNKKYKKSKKRKKR